MDYTGSIAVTGKLMDAFTKLNTLFKNESIKNSNLQLLEPLTCYSITYVKFPGNRYKDSNL